MAGFVDGKSGALFPAPEPSERETIVCSVHCQGQNHEGLIVSPRHRGGS